MTATRPALVLATVLVTALACGSGCGGATHNHVRGLGVVGGFSVVVGGTLLVDGLSCDQSQWLNGSCERDAGELRNGIITATLGGAAVAYALWWWAHHPEPAETRPRPVIASPAPPPGPPPAGAAHRMAP